MGVYGPTRSQIAACALMALVGAVVAIALNALDVSLLPAAGCGLGATFAGAYLLTATRMLGEAQLGHVLGYSFGFVVIEWPFVWILALILLTSPGDWG
jgi:hypothetical protein